MAKRARKRPPPSSVVLRWLAVGALVLVGLLYYRPVRAYLERSQALAEREAQVAVLAAQRARLERQLRHASTDEALAREARGIGYVKPGERLFIVKGIAAWRAEQQEGATIVRGER